jgi:hypothetical protein
LAHAENLRMHAQHLTKETGSLRVCTYKKKAVDDAKLFNETLPEGSKNRISEVRISQGPVVAHSLAMV